MQMQVPMMTVTPGYQSMQPQAIFQSMTQQHQQQPQQQPLPFGAGVNPPMYTGMGMMMPPTGGVQPQQPFVGMMAPGMGQQQWPGNANPYAGGAPQGQWYG